MKLKTSVLASMALVILAIILSIELTQSSKVSAQQGQDAADRAEKIKAAKEALAHPFDDIAGKPADDFNLQTLDGKPIRIADFKQKPLLLSFFRIKECQPCINQLQVLSAASRKYGKSKLAIVGVVKERAGLESTQADLEKALQAAGAQYPVAYANDHLVSAYGNTKIVPYNVYITRSGKVFRQAAGQDLQSMSLTIEQLLASK